MITNTCRKRRNAWVGTATSVCAVASTLTTNAVAATQSSETAIRRTAGGSTAVSYVLHFGSHAGGVREAIAVASRDDAIITGRVIYAEVGGVAVRSSRILCLHVSGRTAQILWQPAPGPDAPSAPVLTEVVDQGAPVEGSADLIRNSFLENDGYIPPDRSGHAFPCGKPVFEPVPVESGDVIAGAVVFNNSRKS